MRRVLLLLIGPIVAGFIVSAATPVKPHPDALANIHAPGDVDRPELVPFIAADPTNLPGIVVDDTAAQLEGAWQYSTHTPPYVGLGYLHDRSEGKGAKSATFTPDLPREGWYEVRLAHCYNIRRAPNAPILIRHADGETALRINQQEEPPQGRLWRTLGTFRFAVGRAGYVRIGTDGTEGKYVIADAVQFLPTTGPGRLPPRFVSALRAGRPQHVVIFGTSLSKGGAWVPQLQQTLDAQFPGLVKLTNSARGGQHSGWGVANVDAGVVARKPDVVFIEFAINDAVTRFDLSLEQVRRNVDTMLDRIARARPECEIILQVMNPAVGKPEGDFSHRRNQDAYQQIYRDAAKTRGLRLIDHSIAWNALLAAEGEAGFKRCVPDGVHPNAEGWTRFVMPVLLSALDLSASKSPPSAAP